MKKIILGFVGPIASGKDTAAKYLADKYGSHTYSFSGMLRDALDRFYLEFNRDNLIKMSEAIRQTFGENIMAKTMARDVEKDISPMIAIPNIRRPADIEFLSQNPNFVLVRIDAETKIRYERLTKRGEKVDDNTKTFEQFLADEQRSTEVSVAEVAKQATELIDNNGNREDLFRQVDELVKKHSVNEQLTMNN